MVSNLDVLAQIVGGHVGGAIPEWPGGSNHSTAGLSWPCGTFGGPVSDRPGCQRICMVPGQISCCVVGV
eukprot:14696177-Ditylum_brightwellii.AAC.1